MDHPAERCTKALGDTCSAALEVSLDTLHISVRAGLNGNKHAMVPTRQGIVLTAAAAAVVDVSAATAADAVEGAVEPTAVDDNERGAVKATAAVDADETDGLCRPTTAPWPPRPPRAPPPHPWPLPRGLKPVARAWMPPIHPSLVPSPSIHARASPSSSYLIPGICDH